MTGKELQEKLKFCGMKQIELATAMGISPQGLSSIFGVADVKTGTIEKFAEITGRPLSYFYGPDVHTSAVASADGATVTGDNNNVGSILGECTYGSKQAGDTVTIPVALLEVLKRQLEEKDQQIAQLIRALSR